jgi:protein SCO1
MKKVLAAVFFSLSLSAVGFAHGSEKHAKKTASPNEIPVSTLVAEPGKPDPSEVVPKQFNNVGIVEKLGTTLDLGLAFSDEDGKAIKLVDLVDGIHPVIFTLNYYSCETLCNIQLNAVKEGLKGLDPKHLVDTRIVTVSFDPRDGAERARKKRDSMLETFDGQAKPQWRFLTGTEQNIRALADALGFQYRWDEDSQQFAHTAAIFFVSGRGIVSRYLYGIQYSARDIRFASIDASEGKQGSSLERVILNCFHYDAQTGKYTPFAMKSVRVGGIVTVSFLGIFLGAMWRREKRRGAGGWDRVV